MTEPDDDMAGFDARRQRRVKITAWVVIAALILTFAFSGTSEPSPFTQVRYSQSQTFGFILIWCIPAGIALSLIVAMILDRTIGGRTREMNVVREVTDETEQQG